MTRFSYEVPLAHLKDFDEYQDLYFALSFLCDDPYYMNFIKDNRRGRKVILDNSFNELGTPDTPSKMARIFNELEADMVVSPDSDEWSLEQLKDAYKELISLVPKEKVLMVIRSKEEYEWLKSNISSHYCVTFYHRPQLQDSIKHLAYHFLGLLNPWEIRKYSPISCDTSMPIKLALQGRTIDGWMADGCPHIHTKDVENFFTLTLTEEQLKLAKENCQWIKHSTLSVETAH